MSGEFSSDEFSIIGKPLPKVDGMGKCTGQTKFADDLDLSRMLFGRLLRSVHAHALIKRIDTSRAEALPGVYAVLTGKDLPIKFGI
ncbi:MAG: 4-hydroxybenzoyl-CoA reductase subunit alpha, partial [Armatimonadota bacterium]